MPSDKDKKEEEKEENLPEEDDADQNENEEEENDQDQEADDAEDEEDDVPVYVEKDLVPQVPYESEHKEISLKEVEESKVINTRKTMKVRISRRRCEFHSDAYNLVDREPGDLPVELKPKKITSLIQNKMVLDIGLQAARPMKSF